MDILIDVMTHGGPSASVSVVDCKRPHDVCTEYTSWRTTRFGENRIVSCNSLHSVPSVSYPEVAQNQTQPEIQTYFRLALVFGFGEYFSTAL